MKDLLQKYNKAVPRYTSYPPVPFWEGAPTQEQWLDQVNKGLESCPEIDLYLHIPFCQKLCWYCGCNRVVSKNLSVQNDYLGALTKEWRMYKDQLKTFKVASLHLGGGTPTFLTPENMEKLFCEILPFRTEDFLGSVEVDPRTCSENHLKVLKNFGFNRISMGIQDFNPQVQAAINRHQSVELVRDLVKKARRIGFRSINFDLIYGLPKQTLEGIEGTLEKVFELRPDSVAFYSYAHVPWKLANQKLIKEDELPDATLKMELYLKVRDAFRKEGYLDIGLDHFALKDGHLGQAFLENRLVRNFMGYTDKKSPILLGLGVSSISSSDESFIQNEKDLKGYYAAIEEGRLPIESGHIHLPEDKVTDSLIQRLMCQGELEEVEPSKRDLFSEFVQDGLLSRTDSGYQVTDRGRPFLRIMAEALDFRLQERKKENSGKKQFSQSV